MSSKPYDIFDDTGTESQVRSFAERYGLSPKQATAMLCKLGLSLYQTVGKEFPEVLLRDLAGCPQENLAQEVAEQEEPEELAEPKEQEEQEEPKEQEEQEEPKEQEKQEELKTEKENPPIRQQERRRHHRANVTLPVLSESRDSEGNWASLHSSIVEISMKGLLLQVPKDAGLLPESMIKFFFPKYSIEAEGTVRHLEEEAGGSVMVQVGVELTKMSRAHWLRWLDMVPNLLQAEE